MNRSFRNAAALAALSLLPTLAAKPARAQNQKRMPAVIAVNDIALTEAVADRPLSAQEKTVITDMDRVQFLREPDWMLQNVSREAKVLQDIRRSDPVSLAGWRKSILVNFYFSPPDSHVTVDENKVYVAIYTHDNPIIAADSATKTIITERDVDAWVAATKVITAASGVPVTGARAEIVALARDPEFVRPSRIYAANMERNWVCYQLCWSHEPAPYRKQGMTRLVGDLPRRTAKQPADVTAAVEACTALVLALDAYADYPAALSPQFAARKQQKRDDDAMVQGYLNVYGPLGTWARSGHP